MKTKCSIKSLEVGSYLSRTSYMQVKAIRPDSIEVQNEHGVSWSIGKSIVEAECFTAHTFATTVEMPRTELAREFANVGDAVVTVNFHKQPKVEDAFDAIANKGEIKSNAEIRKALAKEMKGEPRTLIGYVIGRDESLGRSMVVDLEQPEGDRIRQVDHRTLNWFICRDVKYVVKK